MKHKKPDSATAKGAHGEHIAAQLLKQKKFKVLHQNYKTPRYEIDIIAKKKKRLYFIEVKYRSSAGFGYGHEYVTQKKLEQMAYAAKCWMAEQASSTEYQLAVVSVDGNQATLFLDIWQ